MQTKNLVMISLQVDQATAHRAKVEAAKLDISRSEFIRRLLDEKMQKREEQKNVHYFNA